MTDWHSPATLTANAVSFSKFVHALLGIYAWEWAITLEFDLSFLTGKRKFQWPMIFYFYGRYMFLGGLIGLVIILDSPTEVNCMAAYRILSVIGNTCLGVASINLYIRTMAIWGQNRYITTSLLLLSAGHFGIIIRSVTNAKSKWVDGSGCVTIDAEPKIFAIMYIYTMAFDLIILILTGYKLWYNAAAGMHNSEVAKLLFQDGLVYFIVAFSVNTLAVIFSLMNLNPIMALIADIPATTFATIAAGRVVRRLSSHDPTSGGRQELCVDSIGLKFNSESRTGISQGPRSKTATGVHIEMATFPERDDERSTGGYEKAQVQHPDLEANEAVFDHKGSVFE